MRVTVRVFYFSQERAGGREFFKYAKISGGRTFCGEILDRLKGGQTY